MVDTATPDVGASGGDAQSLPDLSVVPPVGGRITNLVIDRGEASWLITTDGERYLDYSSGIGVTNTGHAHPRVVAAIQAQAAKLLHGQQNIMYHEPGLRLYDRLSRILPGEGWGAFLSNSGAEAIEAAVKLARVATGRPVIIAFRGGFHGRTADAISAAGLASPWSTLPGVCCPNSRAARAIPVPLAIASTQPRLPQVQSGPSGCTMTWPTSPAIP